ncbi:unnamed protein product, partial [Phaeothamnion confervicola]
SALAKTGPGGSNEGGKGKVEGATIRRVVFSALRARPALAAFLGQTQSTLAVVIAAYNADARTVMPWAEFIAHLQGRRDPYVVSELLPTAAVAGYPATRARLTAEDA